ncbi:DinB superfamily protein [Paenibacillus algorifonticola]|uniref:DinB superfamily protein n=1 Tax=Paenibacillus algorifonticola TaxID=684063 RepID=A0A1I2ISG0_9BACL|nr:DinB family protein [Paenibacillus algorifonticola]SFF45194.1 DinB superfamily protein [Paenibacillus algorifonticola]
MDYSQFAKQLEITRGNLYNVLESVSETSADNQPAGFSNTIRWNVGHILTVAEMFIFNDRQTSGLPKDYNNLFAPGTKPSDWTGESILLATLLAQLHDQAVRIKQHVEIRCGETLPEPLKLGPFLQLNSMGEVCHLALFHEAMHTGFIHALKRIV